MRWSVIHLIMLTCHVAAGQAPGKFIFRHLGLKDGLLHNAIYSISQDADGYMWIGSGNGLQRYDGIRFTNYQKGIAALNSEAVPANIYTGDSNNIWFTCGDLVQLNKKSNKITAYKTDKLHHNSLFEFTEYKDQKNRSWLLSKFGLYRPDTGDNDLHYSIPFVPNNTAQTGNPLVRTRSGELWLTEGVNILFDQRSKKVYSPSSNAIHHPLLRFLASSGLDKVVSFLLPDSRGNYWLATWDGQMVFFETITGKSFSYSLPAITNAPTISLASQANKTTTCMFEDSRGTIWAGTNHAGLLRFDNTTNRFVNVAVKDAANDEPGYNFAFLCITEDRDGNLWLGTDKGITIFHPYRPYLQSITVNNKSKQPANEVTAALSLYNGDILATTWGGGFCVYDSLRQQKLNINPAGPYQYSMTWCALQLPDTNVLIGAQHGYLYRYQPATTKWQVIRPPELMNSTIRCMVNDASGFVYFGLHNGHIAKWSLADNKFFRPLKDTIQSDVIAILINKGQVWATTQNGLLLTDAVTLKEEDRYFPVTTEFPNGVKKLLGIIMVNDSVLAVGAQHAGLFFFNTRSKTFYNEPALAGIGQESVHALRKEGNSIWFTTDYGLCWFDLNTKKRWRLRIEEGIISSAFSQCDLLSTPSGQWLTSTDKEIILFQPDSLRRYSAGNARVLVTAVKVHERQLSIDSLNQNKQLVLKPTDNFVTFYFSDMHYNGIGDRSFYYRLSGDDRGWLESGPEGIAHYTNLSPGEYSFEVRAGNDENAPVTTWQIIIHAPFYATWWFLLITSLLIAGTILWAVRRRIRVIRQQSVLQQRIAEAEVSALRAQMNPHFIFNCLTAIDNMIETDQKEKATTYLNRFARLIRSVLDSSKKTLVPLYSDIETLKLYLQLEQFRSDDRFSFQLNAEPQLLQGDFKVPPLVVQPFVENAIHHGLLNRETPGGSLLVTVTLIHNRLHYIIEDNGIGRQMAGQLKLENDQQHTSYGMAITEERIRKFNGDDISKPVIITNLYNGDKPAGTKIEVILKIV